LSIQLLHEALPGEDELSAGALAPDGASVVAGEATVKIEISAD
jgi:hypothetical protein